MTDRMTDRITRPRIRSRAVPLVALAILVAACGGTPTPSGSGTVGASAGTSPGSSPSATAPGAAVSIDDVLADPVASDGATVRVTGNLLADETDGARLCGVLLESYPPQCGGGAIQLVGEVPAATLAMLTTTTEPGLLKAWWGFVTVVGTFHATGAADGGPSIDLDEIVVEAG